MAFTIAISVNRLVDPAALDDFDDVLAEALEEVLPVGFCTEVVCMTLLCADVLWVALV